MLQESILSSSGQSRRELAKEGVMAEVERNYAYLEAHWREAHLKGNKAFGVEDFKGVKHNLPSAYLASIGKDESVKHLIDYETKQVEEIKREVDWTLNRDKGLSL